MRLLLMIIIGTIQGLVTGSSVNLPIYLFGLAFLIAGPLICYWVSSDIGITTGIIIFAIGVGAMCMLARADR